MLLQRLAAGRCTGIGLQHIGLQHVNDDQSMQRDKPRRMSLEAKPLVMITLYCTVHEKKLHFIFYYAELDVYDR